MKVRIYLDAAAKHIVSAVVERGPVNGPEAVDADTETAMREMNAEFPITCTELDLPELPFGA